MTSDNHGPMSPTPETPADDLGLSPPPGDAERAEAEALRRALEAERPALPSAPERPALPSAPERDQELAAQARAAAYLFGARAITPALEESKEQVRQSLQRFRRKLDALERPRRTSRWRIAVAALGTVAAAVLIGILLVPPVPPAAERHAYQQLFAGPFERQSRASERLERILAWRRAQR